ncbi:hypothetical protein GE061_003967 [Apolygus lucorum]|uniref:Tc1-like transposase DDE domain-containing protein n=1 Tax=Apolygus lucorum TaxID=248454 RepID=A0A8S9X1V5_APOLU|nr:hypothetical protein GE061_003967 [Apolygus lucorum]
MNTAANVYIAMHAVKKGGRAPTNTEALVNAKRYMKLAFNNTKDSQAAAEVVLQKMKRLNTESVEVIVRRDWSGVVQGQEIASMLRQGFKYKRQSLENKQSGLQAYGANRHILNIQGVDASVTNDQLRKMWETGSSIYGLFWTTQADWISAANSILAYCCIFKYRLEELRMGHLQIPVGRVAEDVDRMDDGNQRDRVVKYEPISRYGLGAAHGVLLEGIRHRPIGQYKVNEARQLVELLCAPAPPIEGKYQLKVQEAFRCNNNLVVGNKSQYKLHEARQLVDLLYAPAPPIEGKYQLKVQEAFRCNNNLVVGHRPIGQYKVNEARQLVELLYAPAPPIEGKYQLKVQEAFLCNNNLVVGRRPIGQYKVNEARQLVELLCAPAPPIEGKYQLKVQEAFRCNNNLVVGNKSQYKLHEARQLVDLLYAPAPPIEGKYQLKVQEAFRCNNNPVVGNKSQYKLHEARQLVDLLYAPAPPIGQYKVNEARQLVELLYAPAPPIEGKYQLKVQEAFRCNNNLVVGNKSQYKLHEARQLVDLLYAPAPPIGQYKVNEARQLVELLYAPAPPIEGKYQLKVQEAFRCNNNLVVGRRPVGQQRVNEARQQVELLYAPAPPIDGKYQLKVQEAFRCNNNLVAGRRPIGQYKVNEARQLVELLYAPAPPIEGKYQLKVQEAFRCNNNLVVGHRPIGQQRVNEARQLVELLCAPAPPIEGKYQLKVQEAFRCNNNLVVGMTFFITDDEIRLEVEKQMGQDEDESEDDVFNEEPVRQELGIYEEVSEDEDCVLENDDNVGDHFNILPEDEDLGGGMSNPKPAIARGKALRSQAREIVYNVFQYFTTKKNDDNAKYNVREVTSEATGVLARTVSYIMKEAGDRTASDCTGPLSYLRKRLDTSGFKWKKCQSNRKVLIERPEIAAWRARYLRTINTYRIEGKNIVYLDETYVQASHGVSTCWQSNEELGALQQIGKGDRLIIVHGGGEKGFVPNALLIFKASSRCGDYHSSMNFENFSKWLTQKFLPNLPADSVVAMDNAKYHCVQTNKRPNSSTLKADVVSWLRRNNVQFNEQFTKAELLLLVKNSSVGQTFKVDEIIRDAGHHTLHLPPYHPDLNPIELVWGDIKGKLARESVGTPLGQKEVYLKKLFSEYSKEKWVNVRQTTVKKII